MLTYSMATEVQMSPGTESIIRASFAKGFYYNDEDNFLKCVEALIPFDNDNQIKDALNKYRQSIDEIKHIKEDLMRSRNAEIYLSVRMKTDFMNQVMALEQEAHKLHTILTTFVIVTMENKEILKEEFTILKLTKLPLTLKGVKGMADQTDDDEDSYEDY